ncbi:MAG TPA: metal ABC transporter permease, partial [Actinomycetota bacterium]|nr:metal ABC transporter permease [Actinomycetota bacterium]
MNPYELFIEPLTRYGFMRTGLMVAVIVGITSATLSCLLVVRRSALLGDAISHAVLLGVALGWIAGRHVGIFWGALIVGILTGLAVTYIERNSRIKQDTAMGILLTFTFALGLAIISIVDPRGIDLFHVLFGNVLGVSNSDLLLTSVSGGLVLLVVVLLFKEFHLWSFDPTMAQAIGMPTRALQYIFTALLSATIVSALQAVGLILVIAMLIVPGATAYLLTDRLSRMMLIAAAIGLVSAIGGLYGSYYVDVASGPSMVIVASTLFALCFFFAPKRGLAVRRLRRRRVSSRTLDEDILKEVYKTEVAGGISSGAAVAARIGRTDDEVAHGARRLLRGELLSGSTDDLKTTREGAAQALELVRAHRLAEQYLSEVVGLPLDALHREAERMEHAMSPDEVEALDRELGRPLTDPHGHPIPRRSQDLQQISGHPLSEAPVGEAGRILMVLDDREDLLRE